MRSMAPVQTVDTERRTELKLQVKDDSGGRAFVLLQNEWAGQCSGLQKGDTLIISGAFLQPVRQAIQSTFVSRSWRCLFSFASDVVRSWIPTILTVFIHNISSSISSWTKIRHQKGAWSSSFLWGHHIRPP